MSLKIDAIHCSYGHSRVLFGVSLEVGEGEIVSLLGRNGAGKTTTIKSVMGLLPPESGEILISGQKVTNLSCHEIARLGIGWVPQGRRLFYTQTVKENLDIASLKLPSGKRREQFERACVMFPRLAERRETNAGNLSGGEQQMLAIARAMVGPPRVLVLDEPTEGLSPLVVREIMKVIKDYAASGAAILLAEQNVRVAMMLAHRHCILDHGEVRLSGSTSELESKGDELAEYLGVRSGTASMA